jgi:hypothetical protein
MISALLQNPQVTRFKVTALIFISLHFQEAKKSKAR